MKKTISLLLALVLCLSLCACGSKAEAKTSGNGTEGQTVQNTPQNTEQVNTQPVETQPIETEPEEQVIEVTLDNWQNFFEIRQYLSCYIHENDFHEFENASYDICTVITPREELAQSVIASDIAIEFNAYFSARTLVWNAKDFTFAVTGNYDDSRYGDMKPTEGAMCRLESVQISQDFLNDGIIEKKQIELKHSAIVNGMSYISDQDAPIYTEDGAYDQTEWKEEYEGYCDWFTESFEITRIQGTITLDGSAVFETKPVENRIVEILKDEPVVSETKPTGKHTVEITMDNVDTYFEEYTFDNWELNAFNELSHFDNRALFILKEEYAQGLVENETDIAFETKIIRRNYHITMDLENRTWERTAVGTSNSGSLDYSRVQNCRTIYECKERNAYGIELDSLAFLNGVTEGDNHCQESFEILRVSGTLVYKD